MQRVRSPYVAEVIDADLTGDTPYIVTRYVPGRTLEQVVTGAARCPGRPWPGWPAGSRTPWPRCTPPGWCTATSSRAT